MKKCPRKLNINFYTQLGAGILRSEKWLHSLAAIFHVESAIKFSMRSVGRMVEQRTEDREGTATARAATFATRERIDPSGAHVFALGNAARGSGTLYRSGSLLIRIRGAVSPPRGNWVAECFSARKTRLPSNGPMELVHVYMRGLSFAPLSIVHIRINVAPFACDVKHLARVYLVCPFAFEIAFVFSHHGSYFKCDVISENASMLNHL